MRTEFLQRSALIGILAVSGLMACGLPAQAQKGTLPPKVSTSNTQPATDAVVLPPVMVTATAPINDPKADKAWLALVQAVNGSPLPPISFIFKAVFGKPGPADVRNLFGKMVIPDELKRADKAKDFTAQFPNYYRVCVAARILEYRHLSQAYRVVNDLSQLEAELRHHGQLPDPQKFSFTNVLPRMLALETMFTGNTNLSESERFTFRREQVSRLSYGPSDNFVAAAKALQNDFPDKTASYQYLRAAMDRSSEKEARVLAQAVVDSSAPETNKAPFRGFLHRLDSTGTNVPIRFTALDGRDVDTSKMNGKVVLVVFWATWCGPCVGEVPALKSTYDKFHAQGLEIIGISLDAQKDKAKLTKFLKANKIPWPQYFDGKRGENEIAAQFGIDGIPTLFLLDKQGVLRETDARDGLEQKISKLLAEPESHK